MIMHQYSRSLYEDVILLQEGKLVRGDEGSVVVRVRCTKTGLSAPDKVYVMKVLCDVHQKQTTTTVSYCSYNQFSIEDYQHCFHCTGERHVQEWVWDSLQASSAREYCPPVRLLLWPAQEVSDIQWTGRRWNGTVHSPGGVAAKHEWIPLYCLQLCLPKGIPTLNSDLTWSTYAPMGSILWCRDIRACSGWSVFCLDWSSSFLITLSIATWDCRTSSCTAEVWRSVTSVGPLSWGMTWRCCSNQVYRN